MRIVIGVLAPVLGTARKYAATVQAKVAVLEKRKFRKPKDAPSAHRPPSTHNGDAGRHAVEVGILELPKYGG